MNQSFTQIGPYLMLEKIDEGSISSVWCAEHNLTKIKVAIKVINKELKSKHSSISIIRELSFLKQIDNPFISELFEFIEDTNYFYLVMEFSSTGNLLNFMNKIGRMSEESARINFIQIIHAIEYLHESVQVVHRNLKAENILLDKYENIRLTGFDISTDFTLEKDKFKTRCGTPTYIAPEIIKGQSYTKSVDIWSVGILLLLMVAGKLPFDDIDLQCLLEKIVYSKIVFPFFFSRSLIDLLEKMLNKDPNQRIEISKIKNHDWLSLQDNSELMNETFNKFSNSKKELDHDIMKKMNEFGLKIDTIKQEIIGHEINSQTAIYKMLYKE